MSVTALDIHRILPQRPPLLLVDAVLRLGDDSIVTAKLVSMSEPCYAERDVRAMHDLAYPPSLMLESFGQSAALLWLLRTGSVLDDDQVLMFAAGRDCEFLADISPGDTVVHEVVLDNVVADTAFATGRSLVRGNTVARFGSVIAVRRSRRALSDLGAGRP
jgi:3-hydroxyacyl-[acyl-carrier-protein] dehydratase